MNIDKLHEFLRDTGSISVNKKLAKGIGLHEAIFYSELASKYKYFKDRGQLSEGGYFYNTIENMKEDTTLSKYQQDKAIKSLVKFDLIDYELGTHNGRSCRLFRIKERIGILRKIFGGIDITVLEDSRVKKLDTNNTNISSEKLDGTGQETEPDGSRNLTRQVKKLDTNNTKVTILKKNTKEGEGEPPSDDFFLACKESITQIANKISENTSFKVQATDKDANKLYEYLKDNGGDEETLKNLIKGMGNLNEYWKRQIVEIDDIYKPKAMKEIIILGKNAKISREAGREEELAENAILVENAINEIKKAARLRNQSAVSSGLYEMVDFFKLYKQKKGKEVSEYFGEPPKTPWDYVADEEEIEQRKQEVLDFIKEYKFKTTEVMRKHFDEFVKETMKDLGLDEDNQLYELARDYDIDFYRMDKKAFNENHFMELLGLIKKIKKYKKEDDEGCTIIN